CISVSALVVTLVSLFLNVAYSWKPLRFSYHTFIAPISLTFAYVFVPYAYGAIIAGNFVLDAAKIIFLIGLFFLFFGRIILKDFRDREGDGKFGKPTFLLRYGKKTTVSVAVATVLVGALLSWSANYHITTLTLALPYFVVVAEICFMLRGLY